VTLNASAIRAGFFFKNRLLLYCSLVVFLASTAFADGANLPQTVLANGGRINQELSQALNLRKQHRFGEAMRLYQDVAVLQQDNALAWKGIAYCQIMLGNTNDALVSYDEYLKLRPDDSRIRDYIAILRQPRSKNESAHLASRKNISVWGATWRSALIPGWGQWYRGQGWLGLGYVGTTVLCLGATEYYSNLGDGYYQDYMAAKSQASALSFFSQTQKADQIWTTLSYLTLTVWGINILDALIFTGRFEAQVAENTRSFQLGIMPNPWGPPLLTLGVTI